MLKLITIFILLASIGVSQRDQIATPNQAEGERIVRKARQALGLDSSDEVTSYFLKMKKSSPISDSLNYESVEEIRLEFPDKIQLIFGGESQLTGSSKLTRTWNGKKYSSTFESTAATGQRTIKDVTSQENKPVSKTVSDVIGKKTASALQNVRKTDPKNIFIESLWTSIFPLALLHPFEKNIEFKYAGKAKSNDKTANVVDVKPSDGKTYRLLFDSETNYLLMMVVSFKETNDRFTGDVEEKYYFSERESIDGLLIPKKIKVEKKATPTGQSPIIKFSNIEIVDFHVNPNLDEKSFEIK